MTTSIQKAFDLVYQLEPERYRIFSPLPQGKELYWTHLYSVYKTCIYWGQSSNEVLTSAILHDVIEDTPYTLGDVKENFGNTVAEIVDLCTKKKGYKGFDPKDTAEYFARMHQCKNPTIRSAVLTIKLADRLDNLTGSSFYTDRKAKQDYYNETTQYYLPIAKELGKESPLNNLLEYFERTAL